jgi:nondiscriminating aspartyl-tRNA synthetase
MVGVFDRVHQTGPVFRPRRTGFAPEHERHLGQWALEKLGSDFLAVEGYPTKKRPFYTHPQPDDPYWTNSFDLLFAVSSW